VDLEIFQFGNADKTTLLYLRLILGQKAARVKKQRRNGKATQTET